MNILPGDIIHCRGSRTRYRVIAIRRDGLVIGENIDTGQHKLLTRPESLIKVEEN